MKLTLQTYTIYLTTLHRTVFHCTFQQLTAPHRTLQYCASLWHRTFPYCILFCTSHSLSRQHTLLVSCFPTLYSTYRTSQYCIIIHSVFYFPLYYPTQHHTSMNFISHHFTVHHFTSIHFMIPHFTLIALHVASLYLTSLGVMVPHLTSLFFALPHYTSPHVTSPHLILSHDAVQYHTKVCIKRFASNGVHTQILDSKFAPNGTYPN